jgi:hypothetical protein
MRGVLVGLGLAATTLLAGDGLCCGDKFLVVGRGVRAQRLNGAVHHASILIYVSPKGGLDAALRETGLDRDLSLAGHKVRAVADRGQLESALASGKQDIVLAGISDMTALEPLVGAAPRRPSLLPIIYNPTGEELEAAKKEYRCVMRSPSTQQGYLAVIEDAMRQRGQSARRGQ